MCVCNTDCYTYTGKRGTEQGMDGISDEVRWKEERHKKGEGGDMFADGYVVEQI